MAVTFRSNSFKSGTATSQTTTEPAGTTSGDRLVALCIAGAVISQPSGWTQRFKDTQGGVSWVVSEIARGGSAPSLAWTWAGSVYYELHIIALQPGVNTVSFDAVSSAGAKGNGTLHNPDPPAVVAVASTTLCVAGGVDFGGSSFGGWTPSTGYLIRSDNAAFNDAFLETKSLSASGSENPGAVGNVVGAAQDYWDGFSMTFTDETGGAATWGPLLGNQNNRLVVSA